MRRQPGCALWIAEKPVQRADQPKQVPLNVTLVEEAVEEQRLEVRVSLVRGCNVTKENRLQCNKQVGTKRMYCCPHLDDATSTPDAGNTCVVQVPIELFGSLTHEHETLCVRDDLGGIEGLLQVIDKLLLVATECLLLWSDNNLASTDTLGLDGG